MERHNESNSFRLLKLMYADEQAVDESYLCKKLKISEDTLGELVADLEDNGYFKFTSDSEGELTKEGIQYIKDKESEMKLDEIKERIKDWKREGYKVDELEKKVFPNKNIRQKVQVPKKKKKSRKKLIIGIVIVFFITIAFTATVYVYVSGMIGSSPQYGPSLQFVKDDVNDKLTLASADPGGLIWNDFEISGSYTSTSFSTTSEVQAGEYISGCSGSITIRHIPTNTLIGTWDFI